MTKMPAITKELTTYAAGDLFLGTDISDKTDDPTGSSFKTQYSNVKDEINKGLAVTPEMFGAAADGVTDDSAEIQLAIDDGRVIYLTSDKTYLVSAQLNAATGTTIIGNGGTLKKGGSLAIMILCSAVDNVTITDVLFSGAPTSRVIHLTTVRAALIERCVFEGAEIALFCSNLTESSISNNRFFNFSKNQILFRAGNVGNTIANNVLDDNNAQAPNSPGTHTIDIEALAGEAISSGNTVVGNSVQCHGTPCQLTGPRCFDNTLAGNSFINTSANFLAGNGLKMDNTGRNLVANNTIVGANYAVNEAAIDGTIYSGNTLIGRIGFSLNNASLPAGPSIIVGNIIVAEETGVHSGTAQAGTPSSAEITLQTTASAMDDAYNRKLVTITAGTGSGQTRTITDYNGTTQVADVSPVWTTTPDATSTYDVKKATGTCPAVDSSSTIKLAITSSAIDDTYNSARVKITGGTGVLGEIRRIADYTGSTQVATVEPDWTTEPDATTTYEVTKTATGIIVNTKGHTIDGNIITDFHIDGIDGSPAAATDLKITNNHFIGIGRYAFIIDQNDNHLCDNLVYDGIQNVDGALVSGSNNVILDNEFFGNLGGSGAGDSRDYIKFSGGTGNLVRTRIPSLVQDLAEDTNVIQTGGLAIETVTNGSPALSTEGSTMLDSSGGAITATLGSGTYAGQAKFIRMIDATTSSTVQVTLHVTSDPEIFTFNAVDEVLSLKWSGSEWITDYASATV